jgi:hypothetical protein
MSCIPRFLIRLVLAAVCGVIGVRVSTAQDRELPIALHPDNPHYFLWRGAPTILITSGEHYGAVLNLDFDYKAYLQTLQKDGLNHTRTWVGTYREVPAACNITDNTLAPLPGRYICPWARSDTPGYFDKGNKFDLTKWDDAYFERLRDFMSVARRCGVVVELNFFCPNYKEELWQASPMNAANNVNGIGDCERTEPYTLKHPDLLRVQQAVVRKVVSELQDFDNLYYEVCNEPYFGGVTMEWQHKIVDTIAGAEKDFPHQHLISLNVANGRKKVKNPHAAVSIFNFHYCHPPDTVAMNYGLNKAIGENETGFRGRDNRYYRTEGWDFIIAGGAVYSNLDYSFAVGHENGTAKINAPGGGGPELWKQLRILKDFIAGFDFIGMKPDDSIIKAGVPEGTTARVLAEPGKAYAVYVKGNSLASLSLDLPPGSYTAEWLNTKTGLVDKIESFEHSGATRTLAAPAYTDDIALRILRGDRRRRGLLFDSDFEDESLEGWRISGNAPTITNERARAGRRALRTSLDRRKDRVPYRTEVSGPRADVGKEYWYGFSIFLPQSYRTDRIWEIVAQWHGVPDLDDGENWRNPVMALSTTNGRWDWVSRWDDKRNTFASGKREYGGTRKYDLGPYERDVWTDWVVHIKWSYGPDGVLEVWKNGAKVIEQNGPNAFNDQRGPYFKMGLYKGWRDPDRPSDAADKRLLYHDEFRMGAATATYTDVAPGP